MRFLAKFYIVARDISLTNFGCACVFNGYRQLNKYHQSPFCTLWKEITVVVFPLAIFLGSDTSCPEIVFKRFPYFS